MSSVYEEVYISKEDFHSKQREGTQLVTESTSERALAPSASYLSLPVLWQLLPVLHVATASLPSSYTSVPRALLVDLLNSLSSPQAPSGNSHLLLNLCLPDTWISHKQPEKIQTRLLTSPLPLPSSSGIAILPVAQAKNFGAIHDSFLFLTARVTMSFII